MTTVPHTLYGLALALALSGCATNLSMMQTAKTLDPGHVRVSMGAGVYVPAGAVIDAVGAGVGVAKHGVDAAARQEPFVLTEADQQALLTSGVALATLPPAAIFEASVRVGLFKDFDAGFRFSTNALRLDAKYRLYHSGDEASEAPRGRSTDLALDVGVSKFIFKNPIMDLLDTVKLNDFDRWDFEAALIISHDFAKWFGLYGGLRYSYSHTSMDQRLVQLADVGGQLTRTESLVPGEVTMHFVGGTVGLRAGHPYLSLLLELTVGDTLATARILGTDRQLGGLTVYPSIGLASQF